MDFLNSKHLTSHDGYLHPFREAGSFTYAALVSDANEWEKAGIIIVSGEGNPEGEGEQHDVVLRWSVERRQYVPREADLRKAIKPNDFVMFQFDEAVLGQPPCFILLQDDQRTVADSRRLQRHEAFTHFFLTAGDYAYRVGRREYRLRVEDHRRFSTEEAEKRAQELLVLTVNGDDLSEHRGEIVAGHSVIWFVESGEDVSIEANFGRDQAPPGKEPYATSG
jgi:hypothetical protein